jgi:putative SOS response-associated peptidase YedK
MCGRYSITTPLEAMRALFDVESGLNLQPRYNVAPTDEVPVLRLREGERELAMMRWGLVPFWAKDRKGAARLINARADTAADKAAFREAFARRRCLIPADGFYEWKAEGKAKQPWRVEMAGRAPFAFAGLWEYWKSPEGEPLLSFTILTTDASDTLRHIHPRMPVILPREGHGRWLQAPAAELLKPWDGPALTAYEVSPRVNSVRNDDPDCLAPLPPPAQGSLL